MSIRIGSLTFDCADPEKQAQFWAAALRLEIEHVGKHKAQISLGGDIVTATEEWSSIKNRHPRIPSTGIRESTRRQGRQEPGSPEYERA